MSLTKIIDAETGLPTDPTYAMYGLRLAKVCARRVLVERREFYVGGWTQKQIKNAYDRAIFSDYLALKEVGYGQFADIMIGVLHSRMKNYM